MENRSSKAVKDFFDVLLDEPKHSEIESQPLAKLLEKVGNAAPQIDVAPELIDPSLLRESRVKDKNDTETSSQEVRADAEVQATDEPEVAVTIDPVEQLEQQPVSNTGPRYENTLPEQLDNGFPVLFFEAMGQTFSVPLVKLKGIYRKRELSKLIGKPKWYSGVQIERDEKLNVVDTAMYLMPEKFGSLLEYSPDYQYIIVIGDSNWGLECNRLIDSTTLSHDEIKWRTDVTRSPWLAGTVKQRMCGLLAVDALIELFEINETK